jgi:hypothetical protein
VLLLNRGAESGSSHRVTMSAARRMLLHQQTGVIPKHCP